MIGQKYIIVESKEIDEKIYIIPFSIKPIVIKKVVGNVNIYKNGEISPLKLNQEVISKDILIFEKGAEAEINIGGIYRIIIANENCNNEPLSCLFLSVDDLFRYYLKR